MSAGTVEVVERHPHRRVARWRARGSAATSGRFDVCRRGAGRRVTSALDGLRRNAPATFTTKADAHAWLTVRQSELLRGDWIDPDLGRLTLGAYAPRWIAEHRLGPRTRDLYEGLYRQHIGSILGGMAAAPPSRRSLFAPGAPSCCAPVGRRRQPARRTGCSGRSFNTAVDDGRIARNPCRIKGADAGWAPERPVASVPQVYALADAIGPQYRAFVITAAMTSLRWGELIALRRRDLDLENGVGVRQSEPHRVPRPARGRPSLRTTACGVVTLPGVLRRRGCASTCVGCRRARTPCCSPVSGGRLHDGKLAGERRLARGVKAAGLPEGFHFHDLRHTGNHLVAQAGASTRELMDRMGHSTMRAALIYQHATEARSRTLADSSRPHLVDGPPRRGWARWLVVHVRCTKRPGSHRGREAAGAHTA